MSELYKRIEALCKEQGITITEMCRRTGVPRANLTELKMGRQQKIGIDALSKIAKYFDVSVDYLSGAEQKERQPSDVEGLSEDEIQLLKAYRDISETDKPVYLQILTLRAEHTP